jgi:hypothetical protein
MQPAILFLIFNRPDCSRQVFEMIRTQQPARLYIAADGPRGHVESDADNCRATRKVVESIDWPCQVRQLFREENLGCRVAVSQAISWFFENEPEGIILEDDCLPTNAFFQFVTAALEKYRHDDSVFTINGCSLGFENPTGLQAFGSQFMNMWGWATWRRSQQLVDYGMSSWKSSRLPVLKLMERLSLRPTPRDFLWASELASAFERTSAGQVNTWDYQWVWTGIEQRKTVIVPPVNLVRNLGFDENATHTVLADEHLGNLPLHDIEVAVDLPDRPVLFSQYETEYIRHRWFRIDHKLRRSHLKCAWKISMQHLLPSLKSQ